MTINTVPGSYDSALVKMGATTFSAATTVDIDNVFTGGYSNYKVFINITNNSTDQNLQLRFLASGTANTNSNYYSLVKGFSASATFVESFAGVTTSCYLASMETYTANQGWESIDLTIFNPYKATNQTLGVLNASGVSQAGSLYTSTGMIIQDQATSFTGIRLFLSGAGNIGGTIRVYGIED